MEPAHSQIVSAINKFIDRILQSKLENLDKQDLPEKEKEEKRKNLIEKHEYYAWIADIPG